MSYTNQTPNYELPQYVADDKPTYLGDFNKAMLDIDTNMKSIDTKATSAVATADNASANATEALSTAQKAQTFASSATTKAENAQTIAENAQTTASNAQSTASTALSNSETANSNATSAKQTAENAQTTAENAQTTAENAQTTAENANSTANTLNTNIENWVSQNIGVNSANVMFNANAKLSLLGLACNVTAGQGTSTSNTTTIGTIPSAFRPKTERIIKGVCIVHWNDSNSTLVRDLSIKPDGSVICPVAAGFNNIMIQSMLCTNGWY